MQSLGFAALANAILYLIPAINSAHLRSSAVGSLCCGLRGFFFGRPGEGELVNSVEGVVDVMSMVSELEPHATDVEDVEDTDVEDTEENVDTDEGEDQHAVVGGSI